MPLFVRLAKLICRILIPSYDARHHPCQTRFIVISPIGLNKACPECQIPLSGLRVFLLSNFRTSCSKRGWLHESSSEAPEDHSSSAFPLPLCAPHTFSSKSIIQSNSFVTWLLVNIKDIESVQSVVLYFVVASQYRSFRDCFKTQPIGQPSFEATQSKLINHSLDTIAPCFGEPRLPY